MRKKRTRHIHKPYFLTVPRVAIEGKIYIIRLKISQVVIEEIEKGISIEYRDTDTGEIERGRVDGEED